LHTVSVVLSAYFNILRSSIFSDHEQEKIKGRDNLFCNLCVGWFLNANFQKRPWEKTSWLEKDLISATDFYLIAEKVISFFDPFAHDH